MSSQSDPQEPSWKKDWRLNVMHTEIPFGKYQGILVADIPVNYLFEVVCAMQPSVFVYMVKELLKDPSTCRLVAAAMREKSIRANTTLQGLLDAAVADLPDDPRSV